MNIVDQLRRDEGEVLYAYTDSLGLLTIGVGVLIDKRKGGGITPEESAYLLMNRVNQRKAFLASKYPWFLGLDEARQGALLNMSYQLGVEGLAGFPKMLKAVEGQQWEEAERQALDSLWAKQTPARAQRVAKQLRTGEWV